MQNNVLQKIATKKEITTKDKITFRTIFDVISALFTDENHRSILTGPYMINDKQQIWFPNILTDHQKESKLKKEGYGNYLSQNWDYLYQFNNTDSEKRKKLADKQKNLELIVFGKINDKTKVIGYHFLGVFIFEQFKDKDNKTMIYKKIKDNFKLEHK